MESSTDFETKADFKQMLAEEIWPEVSENRRSLATQKWREKHLQNIDDRTGYKIFIRIIFRLEKKPQQNFKASDCVFLSCCFRWLMNFFSPSQTLTDHYETRVLDGCGCGCAVCCSRVLRFLESLVLEGISDRCGTSEIIIIIRSERVSLSCWTIFNPSIDI